MKNINRDHPFSPALLQTIENVYSEDVMFASQNLQNLMDYFEEGHATAEEVNFLVMTNDNPVVALLVALNIANPEHSEDLRKIVGQVVMDSVTESLRYDYNDSDDEALIAGDTDDLPEGAM